MASDAMEMGVIIIDLLSCHNLKTKLIGWFRTRERERENIYRTWFGGGRVEEHIRGKPMQESGVDVDITVFFSPFFFCANDLHPFLSPKITYQNLSLSYILMVL